MKIKWGAIVTEGRGKLGGHVASRNSAGAYFRTRVSPINRRTDSQQSNRVNFAAVSQYWRQISDTQRASWDAVKNAWNQTNVFGDAQTLSGFSIFMRVNMLRLSNGLQPVMSGVTPGSIPAFKLDQSTLLDTFPLTVNLNGVISSIPEDDIANFVVDVWSTPLQSPGVSFVESEYRKLGNYTITDFTPPLPAGIMIDPSTAMREIVGEISEQAEGSRIFVRARLIHLPSMNSGAFSSTRITVALS